MESNDYYANGGHPLSASLSSGNIKYYNSSLQISSVGGHGYILRTYLISTSSSAATLKLSSMGSISGQILY